MSRQDANAAFALTSFLYGGNADYIEDLYARYESDPKAVDAEWQSFFQSLKDNSADIEARRRSDGTGRIGPGSCGCSRDDCSGRRRSASSFDDPAG